MIGIMSKLLKSCRGAIAIEYALIVALIVLASMGALIGLAGSTTDLWRDVSTKVQEAG